MELNATAVGVVCGTYSSCALLVRFNLLLRTDGAMLDSQLRYMWWRAVWRNGPSERWHSPLRVGGTYRVRRFAERERGSEREREAPAAVLCDASVVAERSRAAVVCRVLACGEVKGSNGTGPRSAEKVHSDACSLTEHPGSAINNETCNRNFTSEPDVRWTIFDRRVFDRRVMLSCGNFATPHGGPANAVVDASNPPPRCQSSLANDRSLRQADHPDLRIGQASSSRGKFVNMNGGIFVV